jgi:pyruvate formate lyase activating enzyme
MKIGAVQRFSLIDYPGKICAIVFSQGCNFRCPYCHNPELALPEQYGACLSEQDVFSFLEKRKGKLDAVTITGGEPTVQPDLFSFIQKIKSLDYAVKLDTNGSHPGVLRELIRDRLVDYIAMDVKAPLSKYHAVTCVPLKTETIDCSIQIIRESGIGHEFRTTVVKALLDLNDLMRIATLIGKGQPYMIQKFVPNKLIDPSILELPGYSTEDYLAMEKHLKAFSSTICVR